MMHLHANHTVALLGVLFSVLCSPFSAAAQTPPPPVFRYQLVTDGVTIWPLDTVATKASVNAATNQVANVEASVADLAGLTDTLGSRVNALEAALDDLGEDGVWALEGYVNAIGVLSGTPEYSGEIEILEVTTAANAADASKTDLTLKVAFNPAPIAASQVTMKGAAVLDDAFEELTYTCSYPDTVDVPGETRPVYTFTTTFSTPSGFCKVVSTEGAAVGVGDYLPVSGGLSVNGVNGRTLTLTADDGTTLTFIGGLLVEETPVAADAAANGES